MEAGTKLGPYEIVSPLGAGGMGEVYLANDSKLDRKVAIKVLPELMTQDKERVARFEREATTVAALNHPNIVTIYGIHNEGDLRFIAMELVEGETLDRMITRGGMPLAKIFDIAIPLSDAVAAAHDKGIVHRDLKPGNVMVTKEGRVKVLDFGLAKLTAAGQGGSSPDAVTMSAPLTARGMIMGTVPYMSPEQLRTEVVDHRTDLFSLGIMLYEMATGQRPFKGE
ncbi:MAG: serine/threonine protein kinase, partial [Planctomycetes bacterium]|nr:serine/threonine protein kinase [Planctomycetota bacterium]